LKITKIAIAGSATPIRRIGFGFKVEQLCNFLNFVMPFSMHDEFADRQLALNGTTRHGGEAVTIARGSPGSPEARNAYSY
jgi:hypothetical protein